jgi:hypothetical protein
MEGFHFRERPLRRWPSARGFGCPSHRTRHHER